MNSRSLFKGQARIKSDIKTKQPFRTPRKRGFFPWNRSVSSAPISATRRAMSSWENSTFRMSFSISLYIVSLLLYF